MGILDFLQKNKRGAIIAGGTALLLLGLYFQLPGEQVEEDEGEEEEKKEQEKNQTQQNKSKPQNQQNINPIFGKHSNVEQQSNEGEQKQAVDYEKYEKELENNERLKGLTKEQRRKIIDETILLKQSVQMEIPIEVYQGTNCLSVNTVKKIYHRSILISLDNLISVREKFVTERLKNFDKLEIYYELTLQLFESFFQILSQSLMTVIELLDLTEDYFTQCRNILIDRQLLPAQFFKDVAWHMMSEKKSSRYVTRDEYKSYLEFQIEEMPKQFQFLQEKFSAIETLNFKILLNARIDDLGFQKTNISDYDSVKHLRNYVQDPVIGELLKRRTEQLESLIQQKVAKEGSPLKVNNPELIKVDEDNKNQIQQQQDQSQQINNVIQEEQQDKQQNLN